MTIYVRFERSDAIMEGIARVAPGIETGHLPPVISEHIVGPFPWVQLTYEMLRIGPEGDVLATCDIGREEDGEPESGSGDWCTPGIVALGTMPARRHAGRSVRERGNKRNTTFAKTFVGEGSHLKNMNVSSLNKKAPAHFVLPLCQTKEVCDYMWTTTMRQVASGVWSALCATISWPGATSIQDSLIVSPCI